MSLRIGLAGEYFQIIGKKTAACNNRGEHKWGGGIQQREGGSSGSTLTPAPPAQPKMAGTCPPCSGEGGGGGAKREAQRWRTGSTSRRIGQAGGGEKTLGWVAESPERAEGIHLREVGGEISGGGHQNGRTERWTRRIESQVGASLNRATTRKGGEGGIGDARGRGGKSRQGAR